MRQCTLALFTPTQPDSRIAHWLIPPPAHRRRGGALPRSNSRLHYATPWILWRLQLCISTIQKNLAASMTAHSSCGVALPRSYRILHYAHHVTPYPWGVAAICQCTLAVFIMASGLDISPF
jgi:hypothetical protein